MDSLISFAKSQYRSYEDNKIITVDTFKEKIPFEKRVEQSKSIMEKYPTRVPVICERLTQKIQPLDRKKYLCPDDLTMGNFMYVIRKRLKLESSKAIYLFVNDRIIPVSQTLGVVYDEHQDKDGFLYIKYDSESTFG